MSWFEVVYALVKSPLANLWPLLVFPALAGLACEFAARRLEPTRADWRLAAALAAAPGLLFLVLSSIILWRIVSHDHWQSEWQHILKYQVTALVAVLVLSRAAWRAWRRQAALLRLVRLAGPPNGRLCQAARRAGVEVMQLPCSQPECFVAGAFSPKVYISDGALSLLADRQLDAALRHERAHIRGRDTAILPVLGFLGDLGWFGHTAATAYHQSRERAADAAAMEAAGPIDLASALLTLARSERPIPAIGIAGTAPATWRLHAILGNETITRQGRFARPTALASIALTMAFTAWPSLQIYIIDSLCPCHL